MPAQAEPTVFVIDDEEGMRNALRRVLAGAGYAVRTYASAAAFLDTYQPEQPGCLLLDINMPGMSGPELHDVLAKREIPLPIIYLTGFASVPVAVRAMKSGALDFLEKPFDTAVLLDYVRHALDVDRQRRATDADRRTIRQGMATLTPRERQIMDHMVAGRSNKEAALALDISVRTVEVHRARVMQKLGADSLAELVRMALLAGEGRDTT